MSTTTPRHLSRTQPYKAVAGFALTMLGTLLATLQGRTDLDTMRAMDWLIIVGSSLVTAGVVYGITNPEVSPRDPSPEGEGV